MVDGTEEEVARGRVCERCCPVDDSLLEAERDGPSKAVTWDLRVTNDLYWYLATT